MVRSLIIAAIGALCATLASGTAITRKTLSNCGLETPGTCGNQTLAQQHNFAAYANAPGALTLSEVRCDQRCANACILLRIQSVEVCASRALNANLMLSIITLVRCIPLKAAFTASSTLFPFRATPRRAPAVVPYRESVSSTMRTVLMRNLSRTVLCRRLVPTLIALLTDFSLPISARTLWLLTPTCYMTRARAIATPPSSVRASSYVLYFQLTLTPYASVMKIR